MIPTRIPSKIKLQSFNKTFLIVNLILILLILVINFSCGSLSSDTSLGRIKAVNRLYNQEKLMKVALDDDDPLVQVAAASKITNQSNLATIAIKKNNSELGRECVEKIDDQNLLSKIAFEAVGNYTRIAAIIKLTNENLLAKIAINDIDPLVTKEAVDRITDIELLNEVALEATEKYTKIAAINKVNDQNVLLQIALDTNDEMVLDAVFKRINDQKAFLKIAVEAKDWTLRKAAFDLLNNNSLLELIETAKDPALVLASRIRLNKTSWADAFRSTYSSDEKLNEVVGAAALIESPQPAPSDIVGVCHKFICLGDTSRIPELINLLDRYGDITLAEDYLNCGNDELYGAAASWGRAHGYNIGTGYGSTRVRWGEDKK